MFPLGFRILMSLTLCTLANCGSLYYDYLMQIEVPLMNIDILIYEYKK